MPTKILYVKEDLIETYGDKILEHFPDEPLLALYNESKKVRNIPPNFEKCKSSYPHIIWFKTSSELEAAITNPHLRATLLHQFGALKDGNINGYSPFIHGQKYLEKLRDEGWLQHMDQDSTLLNLNSTFATNKVYDTTFVTPVVSNMRCGLTDVDQFKKLNDAIGLDRKLTNFSLQNKAKNVYDSPEIMKELKKILKKTKSALCNPNDNGYILQQVQSLFDAKLLPKYFDNKQSESEIEVILDDAPAKSESFSSTSTSQSSSSSSSTSPKNNKNKSPPPARRSTSTSSNASSSSSSNAEEQAGPSDLWFVVTEKEDKGVNQLHQNGAPNFLNQLKEDIENPKFIQDSLNAEKQLIALKIKKYQKLTGYDWTDIDPFRNKKDHNPDQFKELLEKNSQLLQHRLKEINAGGDDLVQTKRYAFKKALKALHTVKGKSREQARDTLCNLVYFFIRYPKACMENFMNFVVLGPAGSGKTKLADVIAAVFHALGASMSHVPRLATSQDLIAGYAGQTAARTRALLQSQLEKVLFIDEAYTLAPCNGNGGEKAKPDSMGAEAISEMLAFLDRFRGLSIVVLAGYAHDMRNCTLPSNEGLPRRFPYVVELPSFTGSELCQILFRNLKSMVSPMKLTDILSRDMISWIRNVVQTLGDFKDMPFTNQAGDMLNLSRFILEDINRHGDAYHRARVLATVQRFLDTKGSKLVLMEK